MSSTDGTRADLSHATPTDAQPTSQENSVPNNDSTECTPVIKDLSISHMMSLMEETSDKLNTTQNKLKTSATFLVDQVEKIETNIKNLTEEQGAFHMNTASRLKMMETKFDLLTGEMKTLLSFFHEVVGVMNGTRVWTTPHPNTNTAINLETTQTAHPNVPAHPENSDVPDSSSRDGNTAFVSQVQEDVQNTIEKNADSEKEIVLKSRLKQEPLTDLDLLKRIGDGRVYVQERHFSQDKMINIYKLNRKLETVVDVAQEYFHGLRHQPSVQSLDSRYGTQWRKCDRSFYSKRMVIVNKIKEVKKNPERYNLFPDLTLNMAVRVIENIRLGNNNYSREPPNDYIKMSLSGLYDYFRKSKDSVSDYSLILEHQGRTRKEIALYRRYESQRRIHDASRFTYISQEQPTRDIDHDMDSEVESDEGGY